MKTVSGEDLSMFCTGKGDGGSQRFKLRLFIPIGTDSKGKDVVFGPGIHRLLHEIKDCGTIAKAAENIGMAYSKSWKIIRNAEDCLGRKLLDRHAGRGNGSTLTPEGEAYLARYDALIEDVMRSANESFERYFPNKESVFADIQEKKPLPERKRQKQQRNKDNTA